MPNDFLGNEIQKGDQLAVVMSVVTTVGLFQTIMVQRVFANTISVEGVGGNVFDIDNPDQTTIIIEKECV